MICPRNKYRVVALHAVIADHRPFWTMGAGCEPGCGGRDAGDWGGDCGWD